MAETSQTHLAMGPELALLYEGEVMDECRLYQSEFFWRDLFLWLKDQGYLLRPRYRPGWVASWKDTGKHWSECEDGQTPTVYHLMDGTRISDGATVIFKKVDKSKYPSEARIGQLFSSKHLASHPHNHCVPIYDVLAIPGDEEHVLIVMPYLTAAYRPEFCTIGEVVEFFRQVFEGLQFMHSQRIAHRDCKRNNVMMDPSTLYQEPIHPWVLTKTYDFKRRSRPLTRTQRPVNYYLIDFGLSRSYDAADQNPLDKPFVGGDRTVPEYKAGVPVNPFMVDVYCIGNVVRNFIKGNQHFPPRRGFEFLEDLINNMVQDDPQKRPTMDEVVKQFAEIRGQLGSLKLRSRFARRDEGLIANFFYSISHWAKQLVFILKRIPATPIPPPRPM